MLATVVGVRASTCIQRLVCPPVIQDSQPPSSSDTSFSFLRTSSPTVCSVGNSDSCSLPTMPVSSPGHQYNSLESSKLSIVPSIGFCHHLPLCRGRCVCVSTDCPSI